MTTGVVAAGHRVTAEAAVEVLRAGGNAFDGAVAALAAACVAEPVLASLGGGGFLLAMTSRGERTLYDFFCQTPGRVRPEDELDFHPVMVDFSAAQQEFHTGFGAVATPGMVAGMFAVNRELGRMPMRELLEPAMALARDGVPVEPGQAFIAEAVSPILLFSESARAIFESGREAGKVLQTGEVLRLPALADCLDALGREGERLFYEGEIAGMIEATAQERGGSINRADLMAYRVERRRPLEVEFLGARILSNPAPSSGGPLIAFALALAEPLLSGVGPDDRWLFDLVHIMARSNDARRATGFDQGADDERVARLLAAEHLAEHRRAIAGRALKTGGTTHLNVIDGEGNVAAFTVSNGEGCGHVLGAAGFMLNNMLGEEDINPQGFFNWRPDSRISSMMAPTVVEYPDRRRLALGSGGSNRIRTAILQVLCNMLGFDRPLAEAIEAPRLHFERGQLNMEDGFRTEELESLREDFPEAKIWPGQNFFFGGVHGAVISANGDMDGAGDPRRGGVAIRL